MDLENNDDIEENINNNIKKKEGIISFSKLNKYYLLPFICPIFCMLGTVIRKKIEPNENDNKKIVIFITSVIVSLSDILGGLLSFIPSLREKTKNSRNDALVYKINKKSEIELVYKTNYLGNKRKSKKVIFIFF